jgi:argininosuccinate lyase
LIGDLTGLLATLKGLPLAYNRDLQEDKEPFFDAVDQIELGLSAITGMLATSTYLGDRMRAAADSPASGATDLAEFLVAKGTPFREAHAIVGALVRQSIDEGAELAQLVEAHDALGPDAAALLAPGVAVARRRTPGGAGPAAIGTQLERFTARLETDHERVANIGHP